MLEITRQADYALRATLEVARLEEGARIATAEVATRQDIPLPFLAKIVSQLVVRGILDATRGAGGGISLAREAKDITMLEVVEAIDGPIALNRCTRDGTTCQFSPICPVCEVFVDMQTLLVERMESITFDQLIERQGELITEVG